MRQCGASKRGVGEDIWGGGIDFITCYCSYYMPNSEKSIIFAEILKIIFQSLIEQKIIDIQLNTPKKYGNSKLCIINQSR